MILSAVSRWHCPDAKFISKFGVFPFVMPTMGRNNQDCSSCWKKTKVI
jgi:hypothetical protein